VGGLAFSQIITLYATPVFYTYLDALQTRVRHALRRLGLITTVGDTVPVSAD